MSAAELKELREKAGKLLGHADERIVRIVYTILETDAANEETSLSLTPEQEAILDECMQLDDKGLMEYSSWEDAKARILSSK